MPSEIENEREPETIVSPRRTSRYSISPDSQKIDVAVRKSVEWILGRNTGVYHRNTAGIQLLTGTERDG